jgi:UPF0755 protein
MRLKQRLFLIFVLSAILMGAAGYFSLEIIRFAGTGFCPGMPGKDILIAPGSSLKSIAGKLESRGIISNRLYFVVLAKFKGADKKIQAGEYVLSGADTPEHILDILIKGRVKLYRLTIPEGLTMYETAALVEDSGMCSAEKFTRLCCDVKFIHSLGISAATLEGYLFPDTYLFPGHTECAKIIGRMVGRFKKVFKPEWRIRARAMGFTIAQIVTLASMIEKETGAAFERPLISSVFHNRLKRHMRLESDPTVIYGIENFDGNIRKKDLRTRTPYNTYQIAGLPAGPIANPGEQSLKAALYPAETDFLFFVSKNDSTHKFSRTMHEHNLAVKKYQSGRRK